MRHILTASAAAGALLLVSACQRDQAAEQPAPANAAATAPAAIEEPLAPEPTTPESAAQAAAALERTASAAPAQVATYDFDEGDAEVEAAVDPAQGLRLSERGRTYFYRPGETAPYLVREGDYAYAYRDGRLTGVLDRQGRKLDDRTADARRAQAEQALARGRDLRRRADEQAPPRVRQAEASRPQPDRGDDRRDAGDRPAAKQTNDRNDERRDASRPDQKGDQRPAAKGDNDSGRTSDRNGGRTSDRDGERRSQPDQTARNAAATERDDRRDGR